MPDGNQIQFIEDLMDIMTQTQIHENLLKLVELKCKISFKNGLEIKPEKQSINLIVYSQDISTAFIRRYY